MSTVKLTFLDLQDRERLVAVYAGGAPTAALSRGITWGLIEMYGRFTLPGLDYVWIAACRTSERCQERYLMLRPIANRQGFAVVSEIEEVPWRYWMAPCDPTQTLNDVDIGHYLSGWDARFGDHRVRYIMERRVAREAARLQSTVFVTRRSELTPAIEPDAASRPGFLHRAWNWVISWGEG